jgi:hypothetical protein
MYNEHIRHWPMERFDDFLSHWLIFNSLLGIIYGNTHITQTHSNQGPNELPDLFRLRRRELHKEHPWAEQLAPNL